jgi:hypothetical protein
VEHLNDSFDEFIGGLVRAALQILLNERLQLGLQGHAGTLLLIVMTSFAISIFPNFIYLPSTPAPAVRPHDTLGPKRIASPRTLPALPRPSFSSRKSRK